MTMLQPQYRLTLYALPSVDATETTVLIPAAGAPHGDQFKITTMANLAGWKPYLQQFRGRRGRINPNDRSIDVGSIVVAMLDAKVTGQDAKRWVSAFFGDGKGRPRGKHRALFEESLDNGQTWSTFWTGRLIKRRLVARDTVELEIRDVSDDLKMMAFVGEPHPSITYGGLMSVMPLGVIRSAYGLLQPVLPLAGTVSTLTVSGSLGFPSMVQVSLDVPSQARVDNVVTKNLTDTCPPNQITGAPATPNGEFVNITWSIPVFSGRCRARVTFTSGALSGQTGDYMVGSLAIGTVKGRKVLNSFLMQTVDPSDRFYLALPANGVGCTFSMYLDAQISTRAPLMLNDVDAAQLIQDLCDGKFGYWYRPPEVLPAGKSYGDVKKTVVCANSAAFLGTRPLQRFLIKKPSPVIDFLEQHLLQEMNWALYLDRQGRLTIVDLTTPTTLAGLPTIVDTDTQPTDASWEHDTESAITRLDFTHYIDQPILTQNLVTTDGSLPQLSDSGVVQEYDAPLIVLNVGSADFTDQAKKFDADGFRAMQGETEQGQDKFKLHENYLAGLANQLRMPYGWGTASLPLVCKRTTTVNGLKQGDLALLNVSWVPNHTTWQRGGTRVVRVLEVYEDGPTVTLQLLDLGVNAFINPPTLGALSLETSNGYTGINLPVTLNGNGDPVECRYAVTDTSVGTIPVDTSPLWTFGFLTGSTLTGLAYSTGTTVLRPMPPGKRIWVQVRSVAQDQEPHFPSTWVSPGSGNIYIDTTAVPTPTITGSSLVTAKTARVSFTPGASDLQTQVLLAILPTIDSVTRADSAVTPGSPEFGPGPWTVQSGTWGVSSGKLYHVSGTGNHEIVFPGAADGVFTCDITLSGTTHRANAGLTFRNIDDNNQLIVSLCDVVGVNSVRLYKHTLAGGYTSLQEDNTLTLTPGSTYTVVVTMAGVNIKVSVNGTPRINYNLAGADATTFTSPAAVGLWGGFDATNDDGGSRWDNINFTPTGVPALGTPSVVYATLLPGSTYVDLVDLDPATTFTVVLYHLLGSTLHGPQATIYVTTTAVANVAAAVGGISIVH